MVKLVSNKTRTNLTLQIGLNSSIDVRLLYLQFRNHLVLVKSTKKKNIVTCCNLPLRLSMCVNGHQLLLIGTS